MFCSKFRNCFRIFAHFFPFFAYSSHYSIVRMFFVIVRLEKWIGKRVFDVSSPKILFYTCWSLGVEFVPWSVRFFLNLRKYYPPISISQDWNNAPKLDTKVSVLKPHLMSTMIYNMSPTAPSLYIYIFIYLHIIDFGKNVADYRDIFSGSWEM